jgi:hypothetical protein
MATVSYAQQDTVKMRPDTTLVHPDTKAGSTAFLFTISGLGSFGLKGFSLGNFALSIPGDTLTSVIVYGAGGKWFFLDDIALRGIFGFTIQHEGSTNIVSGETSLKMYGISVGAEKHTDQVFSISPYIGMQTTFAGASIDNKRLVNTAAVENKVVQNSLSVGPLIGFDWYVVRGIAIGGEYIYAYSNVSSTVTTSGVGNDNPTVSKLFIGSANVHLVVHF